MKTIQLPFYAKLALTIISILSFGYLAYIGKEILAPLIIAFLFSILLFPLAAWLLFSKSDSDYPALQLRSYHYYCLWQAWCL